MFRLSSGAHLNSKEKVLLGKWSAIAMSELQRIRFAGWTLTEGQHRPKAGKKKKTREEGLFFLVPTSQVMLHPKWVKKPFPAHVRSIVSIVCLVHCLIKSKLYVDRRRSPGSADRRCRFLDTVPLAKRHRCLGAGSWL